MRVSASDDGRALILDAVDLGSGRLPLSLDDARAIAREVMKLDGLVPARLDPAFRQCLSCRMWFLPKRSTRKFCDDRCRAAHHESRRLLAQSAGG
jgi:hypothetical protein